jgi:hypothetical protein
MITDRGARPNEPQDFQNFIEAYTRGRARKRYCRDPFLGDQRMRIGPSAVPIRMAQTPLTLRATSRSSGK